LFSVEQAHDKKSKSSVRKKCRLIRMDNERRYNAKIAFLVCSLCNIGKDLLDVVVVFNFIEHFFDVDELFL
jgi:hypothetical protein